MVNKKPDFKFVVPVKQESVENVLIDAFESGQIAYWTSNIVVVRASWFRGADSEVIMHSGLWKIHDDETNKTHVLNKAKVLRGMMVLAKKYPRHFSDIISDNYDAVTGDVLIQCALFGEVLYG